MSQSQLANALGVSRSTVTGWILHQKLPDAYLIHSLCVALQCSADWLLGLAQGPEKRDLSSRIRWIEQLPPILTDTQRESLTMGQRFFDQMMTQETHVSFEHDTSPAVRSALQAVFRTGAIRLTHIARHSTYESRLKALYPNLRDVIVADIPQRVTETLIRTEIVAFLAMVEILSSLTRPQAVGLGSGYTLQRLCEQSIASVDQFSGTAWIPLLAFRSSNVEDYTANSLARLMSIRHAGSHAFYLPHPDECSTPEMRLIQQETTQRMRNVQTIFVSTSGVDRRHMSGEAHLLAQFRSADYLSEAPDLREHYADLHDKEQFGAEILRTLIDSEGHVLSRDQTVGNQADLEILRYVSAHGRVCLVAACGYKARAVHTCLKNQLVNTLVIDSEIAEYLLGA
jgi:DNA-binding transcriptional regulator LsrR (DeoR family)